MLRTKVALLVILVAASMSGVGYGSQYVKAIGSNSNDYIYCSTKTSDGMNVSVGYSEAPPYGGKDILLMKIDTCGDVVWTRVMGQSGNDEGRCVIETHDGNLIVVGNTNSFGGSGNNLFISKFNSGGTHQWSMVLSKTDGAFDFYSYAVIEDDSWNLVVTGYMWNDNTNRNELFLSKFNSSGTHLATSSYYVTAHITYYTRGFSLVQATDNGEYVVVGNTYHADYGQSILLARFYSDLDVKWGWYIAGEDEIGQANKIIALDDGGYAVTGVAGTKLFYVRFASDGTPDPHGYRRLTSSNTEGNGLIQLADGGIAIVGNYVSGSVSDVILAKWDSEANLSWGWRYVQGDVQEGYAVSEDDFSEITISGDENSVEAWYAKCASNGQTCVQQHAYLNSQSWSPDEGSQGLSELVHTSQLQCASWSPSSGTVTLNVITDCTSPIIAVISPPEDTILCPGTTCAIRWTSTHTSLNPYLKLDYSTDGGDSWLPITVSTSNDGEYNWPVPYVTSDNCLVRVCTLDGCVCSASGVFAIRLTLEMTPLSACYNSDPESCGVYVQWEYCGTDDSGWVITQTSQWRDSIEVAMADGDTRCYLRRFTSDPNCFVIVRDQSGSEADTGGPFYAYICGDANAAGTPPVDIDDVVFLINFVFGGGPAPCPLAAGDANCSNGDTPVDIDDIVYLINYVFNGGPPPCDCDRNGVQDCCNSTNCECGKGSVSHTASFDEQRLESTCADAELWLRSNSATDHASPVTDVVLESGCDVAGLRISLTTEQSEARGVVVSKTARSEDMTLYQRSSDNALLVGLIDLTGKKGIAAGEGPILTINGAAGTVVRTEIADAMLVDRTAKRIGFETTPGTSAPIMPSVTSISQNQPNPFNPTTRIDYGLSVDGHVKIEVFNLLGEKVRTLVDEFKAAGNYSVSWDGKNESGSDVASGVYFYRFEAGTVSETRKMLLLK